MKTDCALITYVDLPGLDPDDRLLAAELISMGCSVEACIWTDQTIDWSRFKLAVIRSTWDYHLHEERFLEWSRRVSDVTTLYNSAAAIAWNARKTYLRELERKGVSIVPTAWIGRSEQVSLEQF